MPVYLARKYSNWGHYFYVSYWRRGCHFTWSSDPREGLTVCKAKALPWVLVQPWESNPRPPALQLIAQPTELMLSFIDFTGNITHKAITNMMLPFLQLRMMHCRLLSSTLIYFHMSFFTNHTPCYGFSYTIILKLTALYSHISIDWGECDKFKFRFALQEIYDLITDSS